MIHTGCLIMALLYLVVIQFVRLPDEKLRNGYLAVIAFALLAIATK